MVMDDRSGEAQVDGVGEPGLHLLRLPVRLPAPAISTAKAMALLRQGVNRDGGLVQVNDDILMPGKGFEVGPDPVTAGPDFRGKCGQENSVLTVQGKDPLKVKGIHPGNPLLGNINWIIVGGIHVGYICIACSPMQSGMLCLDLEPVYGKKPQ